MKEKTREVGSKVLNDKNNNLLLGGNMLHELDDDAVIGDINSQRVLINKGKPPNVPVNLATPGSAVKLLEDFANVKVSQNSQSD